VNSEYFLIFGALTAQN